MNSTRRDYYTTLIAANSFDQRQLFHTTRSLLCNPTEVTFPSNIQSNDLANNDLCSWEHCQNNTQRFCNDDSIFILFYLSCRSKPLNIWRVSLESQVRIEEVCSKMDLDVKVCRLSICVIEKQL